MVNHKKITGFRFKRIKQQSSINVITSAANSHLKKLKNYISQNLELKKYVSVLLRKINGKIVNEINKRNLRKCKIIFLIQKKHRHPLYSINNTGVYPLLRSSQKQVKYDSSTFLSFEFIILQNIS